jgi:hypothetical protein
MKVSQLEENLMFQIIALKLPRPEREYKFCATRKWRFDFAYPTKKIAVDKRNRVYQKS